VPQLHDTARAVAISGAGTGIGQATAVKFGELGWRVAVGGRRVEKLAETRERVEKAGGTCLAHELDVADGGSVDRFFGAAIVGGPETVRQKLEDFLVRTGADELMINSDFYHHADRLRSYEIVAAAKAA